MDLPFQLPEGREFDVVGFGTNAVDYLVRAQEFPKFGGKAELISYSIEPGGEIASTMVGLQRLGFSTAYCGSFGDDEAGRIGLSSLESEGIDITHTRVVKDAQTQVAFIFVDEGSGERTILWRRDEKLKFSASDAPVELAPRCRILHITPHDTEACIKLAAAAKAARTIVSLDIDNIFEDIDKLLPLVDICLASEEFPSMLTGKQDVGDALVNIRSRYGCSVVGVTLGQKGSLVLSDGRLIETPASAIPGGCVDTTGAGDAFRTGFLYGVLSKATAEECCTYANAVAALKCRQPGARRGLPDQDDITTLLKKI
jgi:sulfofructose kinase